MKNIKNHIHRVIAVLMILGVVAFGLSDYMAELEELRSWAMLSVGEMHIVKFIMYGTFGAAMALLAADGKNPGFRIKRSSLVVAAVLGIYCLLFLFSSYICSFDMLNQNEYPRWLVDICSGIYGWLDPTMLLCFKLGIISGKSTFISSVYCLIYLLTGFFMTHSLFGDKE